MADPTPIATGKVVAQYPSGKKLEFEGALYFGKMTENTEAVPAVLLKNNKEVMVLDPRGIIYVDRVLHYHPRAFAHHLAPWVKKWLTENPAWAPVQGFEEFQAPTGWPAGTRVRKKVFDPGDSHAIGELGRVQGSVDGGEKGIFYSILWDDAPTLPVIVQAHKIERVEEPAP